MSAIRILSVLPALLNSNGDAENARVLQRRAQWTGHTATVIELGPGDPTPSAQPHAVVIGTAPDASLVELRDELKRHRSALVDWIAADVPVLAVGGGWEVLSGAVPTRHGLIEGLRVFPGTTVAVTERIVGDLVVDSPFGQLVGFENHARGYRLETGAEPLGTVVSGAGNSLGAGPREAKREGARLRNAIGTHLHGPVLAKNPALADFMLAAMLPGRYDPRGPEISAADELASQARADILRRLSAS